MYIPSNNTEIVIVQHMGLSHECEKRKIVEQQSENDNSRRKFSIQRNELTH